MDIYEIAFTSSEKITGVMPQVSFETGFLPDDTLRELQRMSIEKVKNADLLLACLSLHEGAKLTDILDTYAIGEGWIVSEDFYNCITKLRTSKVDFLPVLVRNETIEVKYYWINICPLDDKEVSKFIDLSGSIFERFPIGKKVIVKDVNDYEKNRFKELGSYIRWKILNVDSAIFDSYDIVNFGLGRSSIFCLSQTASLFKSFDNIVLEEEGIIELY